MDKTYRRHLSWLFATLVCGGIGACFSNSDHGSTPSSSATSSASTSAGTGGASSKSPSSRSDSGSAEGGLANDAGSILIGNWKYVLIDDMETTTHGPIELDAGISPPLTPGYWYNSGAQAGIDAGDAGDMSNPPQLSFVFTALPSAMTTLNGKVSNHAARQSCVLTGLYDTCGVGFEFAQEPDLDASVADSGVTESGATDARAADARAAADAGAILLDAGAGDAGDAGASIPRVTIPFDISQYRGITFWGKTTTPDPAVGSLTVKVQFPDTDTDPRGNVCNGGSTNYDKCYNSYASYVEFTTDWQQFVVWLDSGDGGAPPDGGIAIDPLWGYMSAQWIPSQVYGINWQAQKNTDVDAGPLSTEIWVDDVYFVK